MISVQVKAVDGQVHDPSASLQTQLRNRRLSTNPGFTNTLPKAHFINDTAISPTSNQPSSFVYTSTSKGIAHVWVKRKYLLYSYDTPPPFLPTFHSFYHDTRGIEKRR